MSTDETNDLLRELLPNEAEHRPQPQQHSPGSPEPLADRQGQAQVGGPAQVEMPTSKAFPYDVQYKPANAGGLPSSFGQQQQQQNQQQQQQQNQQQPISQTVEAPSRGRGFKVALVALLVLAAAVAGAAGATWWFSNADEAENLASSATPEADTVLIPTDDEGSDTSIDAGADSTPDTTTQDAAEGEDPGGPDIDEPGIDPLTGEPFPESIDGLSLAELSKFEYPHAVLGADGRTYFRGRVGTQEEIDEGVALVESVAGPGSVVNEMVVTPGVPPYQSTRLFMEGLVLFDFNSVALAPEALAFLDQAQLAYAAIPDLVITVVGFSDSVGPADVNLRISEQRAQAIADYWVSLGIPSEKIIVEGRGEPAGTDGAEVEEASERRAEFLMDSEALWG